MGKRTGVSWFGLFIAIVGITLMNIGIAISIPHHKAIKPINSPTTAAPFAYACSGGLKVFTTPQGGIAVYPGGKDCP